MYYFLPRCHSMGESNPPMVWYIGVIGSEGVGKSSLTVQFIKNLFIDDYDPTIEDSYRKQVLIDGEACLLEILDTAGQEEYSAMRGNWPINRVQGYICTYSITSKSSFEKIKSEREHILRVKDREKFPMILVGNKCDLEDERQVTAKEAQNLSELFECPMYETSAKARINVENIFFELVREIKKDVQNRGMKSKHVTNCILL